MYISKVSPQEQVIRRATSLDIIAAEMLKSLGNMCSYDRYRFFIDQFGLEVEVTQMLGDRRVQIAMSSGSVISRKSDEPLPAYTKLTLGPHTSSCIEPWPGKSPE